MLVLEGEVRGVTKVSRLHSGGRMLTLFIQHLQVTIVLYISKSTEEITNTQHLNLSFVPVI